MSASCNMDLENIEVPFSFLSFSVVHVRKQFLHLFLKIKYFPVPEGLKCFHDN